MPPGPSIPRHPVPSRPAGHAVSPAKPVPGVTAGGRACHGVVSITVGEDCSHPIDADWLSDRLKAALGQRPERFASVALFIVGDDLMAELHEAHLGEPTTTDVLTFDLTERSGEGSPPIEVEVVVSAQEAARRAAEFGHGVDREVLLYAIHGLLHCGPFDDHSDEGARLMHEEEDRILEAIGVGATYRSPSPRPAAGSARPRRQGGRRDGR